MNLFYTLLVPKKHHKGTKGRCPLTPPSPPGGSGIWGEKQPQIPLAEANLA